MPIVIEDSVAEFCYHGVSHVVLSQDVTADVVHVDHGGTPLGQQSGHRGFAGADAAAEADDL